MLCIMKFFNKMERKFGKYAIPNLTMVIICCFVIGYILQILAPDVYEKLLLIPYNVVKSGEWWRLFTWIFTTPSSFNIFTLIMLFFYYSIGRQLEMTWGKFMYNLYIFGGMFFITVGVLIASLIYYNGGIDSISADEYALRIVNGLYVSTNVTYFLVMSMFLAFAAIYAETRVLLYFIIPIKIKWLAYIDLIYLAYEFVVGDIFNRIVIVMCVMNFFIFYIINYRRSRLSFKQKKRQYDYKRRVRRGNTANRSGNTVLRGEVEDSGRAKKINYNGITRHKCAICGRTENDSDELEFRFCSKCNGNYEYCNEHLFTHEHVK